MFSSAFHACVVSIHGMPCHCLEQNCAGKSLSDRKDEFPMKRIFCGSQRVGTLFAVVTALVALGCGAPVSPAQTTPDVPAATLAQISSDPFTVGPGQHATEVEPHVLANGSTLVAAFQTGRIAPGGSTDIGWATSTDGGTSWSHGFLPGLDRKSTRLNSSHGYISYAVFCLKK